jgi:hypothetical protein
MNDLGGVGMDEEDLGEDLGEEDEDDFGEEDEEEDEDGDD